MTARHVVTIVSVLGMMSLFVGCGGETSGDPVLDPLQLINNVEMNVDRHHPTNYTEVELGEFYVTLPINGSIDLYRMTFTVVIVVSKDSSSEIAELLEERMSHVRDQVIATAQQMNDEKLHDPDLIWLKTELVEVVRRALGTTGVRDIVFPVFTIERG